jgi:hypothetical protein
MPRARIAGVLLVILGVLTLGTGAYFLFLRPAVLPEDLRFTGVDPKLLDPRMITWLGIVFRTWGGFVAGFGILLTVGSEEQVQDVRRRLKSWQELRRHASLFPAEPAGSCLASAVQLSECISRAAAPGWARTCRLWIQTDTSGSTASSDRARQTWSMSSAAAPSRRRWPGVRPEAARSSARRRRMRATFVIPGQHAVGRGTAVLRAGAYLLSAGRADVATSGKPEPVASRSNLLRRGDDPEPGGSLTL